MQMQELAQLHFDAKKGMDATLMQMQTLRGFMIRTIGMGALQRQVWNTFMQKQVLA